MGLFSDIAGAGTAALGVGLSSLFGARAARKRSRLNNAMRMASNAWYDQEYNESPMETTAAQEALRAMREAQNRRMTAARGSAAVMGASAGSVAAEKVAANLGAGQAISDLAARGDALSREARKAYQQREINYYNNAIGEANNMAQNAGLAGSELSKLGGGMMGKNLFGEKST